MTKPLTIIFMILLFHVFLLSICTLKKGIVFTNSEIVTYWRKWKPPIRGTCQKRRSYVLVIKSKHVKSNGSVY